MSQWRQRGRAILHSGTVRAALDGGLNDAWGMAVSLDVGMHPESFHWNTVATTAIALAPALYSARGEP